MKVRYTIEGGQFSCECAIENIALKHQMEAMMGGHSIIRTPHSNSTVYIGPEDQVDYFVGIFNMHGFEISRCLI
jgi:hypothetical protein